MSAPAVTRGRLIWVVVLTRELAEERAEMLKRQGRRPRIYPRSVRAEGLRVTAFVVVAAMPKPKESR